MAHYTCYVDGGCPDNHTERSSMYGSYIIYDMTGLGELDHEGIYNLTPVMANLRFPICPETFKCSSNNVAEAMSLYMLMSELVDKHILTPDNTVTVYCDSQLTINQLIGVYAVKKQHLKKIHSMFQDLFANYNRKYGEHIFESLALEWLPGDVMKKTKIDH